MGCCSMDRETIFVVTLINIFGWAIVALLVVGLALARPYGKISHFTDTVCNVSQIIDRGEITCDCGTDEYTCSSSMPCVQIRVDYTGRKGEIRRNATLFETPYQYPTLRDIGCSTRSCSSDAADNKGPVKEFVEKYGGLEQTYPCFFNPEDPSEALLYVIPQWAVLLGMLLPTGLITASALVTCFYYKPHDVC